jgi:hypothetical protein
LLSEAAAVMLMASIMQPAARIIPAFFIFLYLFSFIARFTVLRTADANCLSGLYAGGSSLGLSLRRKLLYFHYFNDARGKSFF